MNSCWQAQCESEPVISGIYVHGLQLARSLGSQPLANLWRQKLRHCQWYHNIHFFIARATRTIPCITAADCSSSISDMCETWALGTTRV